MPTSQKIIISTLTGVFIGAGWWVFVDGAVHAPDAFPWFHIMPGFFIMMSMFALNMVNPNHIESNKAVMFWVFLCIVVAMVCIMCSVWITSVEYPPNDNWPGVSIILQTLFIFMGGTMLFGERRSQNSQFNF